MAQIIQKISVDVSKPNFFQAIVAKQYDSGSRFLRVTFIHCNKTVEIDPTSTVLINATRSDGGKDSFAGVVNDDNTATVPLAYWMLELEGKVECDISIIDTDGNKLTSTSFELMVERASNKGDSISEDENYDVLVQLIEEVKSVIPDQTYNPESENAQSGKAVAQALAGFEGGSSTGTGAGVTEAQKQTLLAIVNAMGLFNVDNAQTLLDNFNKAWDTVEPVPAISITLDKTEITFTTEETQTIVASVLPANTTDVVAWTSSNTKVATVKGGVVTPLVDGETVITATAGSVSATCAVTVNMFGEIENPVFVSSGEIGTTSTATSEPTANTNFPNTVTFSAIPVKAGTLLICNTNIYKQQDWVRFYNYDNDGVNCKQLWYADNTAGTITAEKDGFIRVCIVRNSADTFTTNTVKELSTTTNGVKTTYTLVDRR